MFWNFQTFAAGEQQILCGVQREHRLTVALRSVGAHHRRRFTGRHFSCIRYNLTPEMNIVEK